MENRQKKVFAWVILVLGVIGAVASIWGLPEPSRWYFLTAAISVVLVCIGFFIGISETGSLIINRTRPHITLDEELGDAREVWFVWHTGSVKLAEGDLFKRPRKIKMVLTHPDSQALMEVAKISHLSTEPTPVNVEKWKQKMASDIRELTARVREKGNEVLWFDGPVQNSIIITNPNGPDGCARVEFLLPYQEAASRPSIRVWQDKDMELFARIKGSFEDLCRFSQKPC